MAYLPDILIIAILVGFIVHGYKAGFIKTLVILVGIIIGTIFSAGYYESIAVRLIDFTGWNQQTCYFLTFITIIIIFSQLVNLVFWLLTKVFHFLSHIPFAKLLNRLLGIFFGMVEGYVVVSIIVYFLNNLETNEQIAWFFENSLLAPLFLQSASFFLPLADSLLSGIWDKI